MSRVGQSFIDGLTSGAKGTGGGSGMGPAEWMMLANMGMSFLGNLFGGGDQEMKSFDNGPFSANAMMGQANAKLLPAYDMFMGRAQEDIELPSAFVQDLPTFSGGGLPMPFGATGRDRGPTTKKGVGLRSATRPRQGEGGILPGTQGPGRGPRNPAIQEALDALGILGVK